MSATHLGKRKRRIVLAVVSPLIVIAAIALALMYGVIVREQTPNVSQFNAEILAPLGITPSSDWKVLQQARQGLRDPVVFFKVQRPPLAVAELENSLRQAAVARKLDFTSPGALAPRPKWWTTSKQGHGVMLSPNDTIVIIADVNANALFVARIAS